MASAGVDLTWVDNKAPSTTPIGTAFGIPWEQGKIDRTTAISVSASGKGIPVQTWPLAYWPDGSLKWTGHALAADTNSETVHLSVGTPTEPASPVSVQQSDSSITVTTGNFTAKFNTSGTMLIDSLSLNGKVQAQNGALVVHIQDAIEQPELGGAGPNVAVLAGTVDNVTVEQNGPVRAVIKVIGKYSGGGHADFLPFTLRFYISAGATALRVVHFFIYDGDQNKDFLKGIASGISFTTPLSDELYDRHIRFVTADGGIWGEAVRGVSGLRRDATAAVLNPQFQGTATPAQSAWPATVVAGLQDLPVWADFVLDQTSSERFTIAKRTNAGSNASYLTNAGFGTRASGVGYVGGANGGGVVFALKDFWQSAPKGLDIRNAGTDTATVTLWAYSPRAPASDMRHYDTVAHGLDLTYEDVGNPDPNPVGIGRSYEVSLQLVSSTPSRTTLAQLSAVHSNPPQLVASPAFYVSRRLFGGRWDVPDTSTSGAAAIEKRKSDLLDFYLLDIAQRQFYGFWDYGDVMHTYDQTRHTWRYDVGGYAWDNGELDESYYLNLSMFHIFRIASSMTRHLSEVDFHHTGTFAGLGSRHHVTHWGDGAKEVRISASTLKRPFYYLTTDELMGDIMDYSLQADNTLLTWEPLRKVFPLPPDAPSRVRIGPDWTSLAGNWFTKWERTNDPQWRDRIKVGMHDIGAFQYGLFTGNGAAVGWDPATAHLIDEGGAGLSAYDLMMFFGGGEFLMELVEIITDEPEFDAAWVDFCRLYNGTDAEKMARYGITFNSGGFNQLYSKLQAYAGQRLDNTDLKKAAWAQINTNTVGVWPPPSKVGGTDVVNPITEIVNLTTNDSAALSLAEYAVLAIAPELAPNTLADSLDHDWDSKTVATEKSQQKWKKANSVSSSTDGHHPKPRSLWKKLICSK